MNERAPGPAAEREPATPGALARAVPPLVLGALVAVLYWPTLGFDFLNWDDPWYVTQNPRIRSWHPGNLAGIATEAAVRNYAPLTTFSFLLDYTVWGLWAGGYHLTNVVLHALNAALVFVLLHRLAGSRFMAWTTAALFAVHPVQIETVAWVSSRKGLLSATFVLAALVCWLRPNRTGDGMGREHADDNGREAAEDPRPHGHSSPPCPPGQASAPFSRTDPSQDAGTAEPSAAPVADGRWYAVGLGFFVLALLSKAIAVVVPALVAVHDVLVRRERIPAALARQVIPGLLAAWLLLTTMGAQTTLLGGVRDHFELSKAHLLAVDSVILWRYVGMLGWPRDLCVLYDPPVSGIAGAATLSILGWLAVGWWAWRCRRRRPLVTLAATAWLVLLLPVLNLFPITTLMNDRYLYLPSIPVFALAAAALESCVARASERVRGAAGHALRTAGCLAVGGAVVLFAGATARHLPVWRDSLALWQHAAEHVPHLAVVRIQLAYALRDAGRDEEAEALLESALAECRTDEPDRRRIERRLAEWRSQQP